MNNIIKYVTQVMAEPNGVPSSKRWIVFICTVLVTIGFLANLFGGYKIDPNIFNSVMYVIIGGMGITGAEKFSPKYNSAPAASTDASSDSAS